MMLAKKIRTLTRRWIATRMECTGWTRARMASWRRTHPGASCLSMMTLARWGIRRCTRARSTSGAMAVLRGCQALVPMMLRRWVALPTFLMMPVRLRLMNAEMRKWAMPPGSLREKRGWQPCRRKISVGEELVKAVLLSLAKARPPYPLWLHVRLPHGCAWQPRREAQARRQRPTTSQWLQRWQIHCLLGATLLRCKEQRWSVVP